MKKKGLSYFITAVAALSLASGIQSCNKDGVNGTEKKIVFTTNNLSFKIPVILKAGETANASSFIYRINMDSFVKTINPNFDTLSIRSVILKSCELVLEDDTTVDNFRNFHTCTVGISTNKLQTVTRIASATDIPDTTVYHLNVPRTFDIELRNHFMADTVYYRLYGNMRKPTTKDLGCKAILTYDMTLAK